MGVLLGSAGTCLGSWIKVSTMVESQLIILCLDWSGVRHWPGPVVGGLLWADGGGGQPDLHPGHPRPAGRHLVPAKPDEHRHLHRGVRQPGESRPCLLMLQTKAIRRFVITEKAPTRAFSWLKAAATAFTFKTLLRHYAKQALTPRSLNVKLGPRPKGHKGRAVWLA